MRFNRFAALRRSRGPRRADHGLKYVRVRGDGKAVDQRFSWTASLPLVPVDRIYTATSPSRSSETTLKTLSSNFQDLFRSASFRKEVLDSALADLAGANGALPYPRTGRPART